MPVKQKPKKAPVKASHTTLITTLISVVALVAVVIVALIVFLPKNSTPPPTGNSSASSNTDGPKNAPFDAVTITGNGTAYTTDSVVKTGTVFTQNDFTPRDDGKVAVAIYFDPQCPSCGLFEKTNSDNITAMLKANKIALVLHPISFLDRASSTNYSSRAANALACVANSDPNSFYDFFKDLYVNQPAEGSAGLPDSKLVELAKAAGATNVSSCITKQTYGKWVADATNRAISGPLTDTNDNLKVTQTPFILINGVQYTGSISDSNAFTKAVNGAVKE